MRTEINTARLHRTKRGFTTRNVPQSELAAISAEFVAPEAGDIVLARVTGLGQHRQVELPTSRKSALFIGDEVILAYGNRYAPDQFEAFVPTDLGPCEMVAAGGVAGRVAHSNGKMASATQISPLGLFVDSSGKRLNLRDFALPQAKPQRKVPGIAVVGGSMNAGKTTAAASLVHGFARAGYKVGAAKITGTGAGNDSGYMLDAGAFVVYDFTDAGLATTYRSTPAELEQCANTLAAALTDAGAEIMIFEIADGLFQEETAWLVQNSKVLRNLVDGYLYAGESAASVASGVAWLKPHGTLLGVSGLVSVSPLAAREAQRATGFQCLTKDELASASRAKQFMQTLQQQKTTVLELAA